MRRKVLIVLILSATGVACANWLPASSNEISPGEYEISAAGNSFISVDSLKKKVEKKAAKKCDGDGYTRTKKDQYQSHESKTYTNGGYQTSYYFTYTITIKCGE